VVLIAGEQVVDGVGVAPRVDAIGVVREQGGRQAVDRRSPAFAVNVCPSVLAALG